MAELAVSNFTVNQSHISEALNKVEFWGKAVDIEINILIYTYIAYVLRYVISLCFFVLFYVLAPENLI